MLLAPWGGAGASVDACEANVRTLTVLEQSLARTLRLEPAQCMAATYADLTGEVGAMQISRARWLLDV